MNEARAGMHNGPWHDTREKRAPSPASASNAGVITPGSPAQPIMSARCWSDMISTMFGAPDLTRASSHSPVDCDWRRSGTMEPSPQEGAAKVDESMQQAGVDAGRAAGMFAGMFSGAKLGNAAIPVPVLGTVVGGVVGGLVGSEIGQRLGRAFVSGGEAFWHTLQAPSGEPTD